MNPAHAGDSSVFIDESGANAFADYSFWMGFAGFAAGRILVWANWAEF